jgi:hypothetical protein
MQQSPEEVQSEFEEQKVIGVSAVVPMMSKAAIKRVYFMLVDYLLYN